ncbi:hypothetical protein V6N13_034060 [Hibiscus sabdariffa]
MKALADKIMEVPLLSCLCVVLLTLFVALPVPPMKVLASFFLYSLHHISLSLAPDPFGDMKMVVQVSRVPNLKNSWVVVTPNSPSQQTKSYRGIHEDQNQNTVPSSRRINVNYNENPQTLMATDPNPKHNQMSGTYHVPFESATSVSWLRQTPFSGDETDNCNFQILSLTMTPISGNGLPAIGPLDVVDNRKPHVGKTLTGESVPRKSIDTFGQRTSQYRGFTKHRWTGRYKLICGIIAVEKRDKQGKGGKVRAAAISGYDKEEKAASAYDLAALKYWGPTTHINFPLTTYAKELEEMKNMTRQEFVAHLRRHHLHGRWQARIGRVAGNKDLYLGTFSTQEEAAEAYDISAIKFRGTSAVTNFDISRYDIKRICSSSTLIGGDLAKRSPKGCAPIAPPEDYNSCASSSSPQPIRNGLVDMVWTANSDEQQHQSSNTNNDGNLK